MKTTFFTVKKILFLTLITTFCACSDGEDGAIGPQGPQGEQGPAGQDGQDGTNGQDGQDGTDGQDGNANVIFSDWIDGNFGSIPATSAQKTINDSEITVDVVSNAAILGYARRNGNVIPLPTVFADKTYSFNVQTGSIIFTAISTSFTTYNDFEDFRYVIIPPASAGKIASSNNPIDDLLSKGVDVYDYQEVLQYFNFND